MSCWRSAASTRSCTSSSSRDQAEPTAEHLAVAQQHEPVGQRLVGQALVAQSRHTCAWAAVISRVVLRVISVLPAATARASAASHQRAADAARPRLRARRRASGCGRDAPRRGSASGSTRRVELQRQAADDRAVRDRDQDHRAARPLRHVGDPSEVVAVGRGRSRRRTPGTRRRSCGPPGRVPRSWPLGSPSGVQATESRIGQPR